MSETDLCDVERIYSQPTMRVLCCHIVCCVATSSQIIDLQLLQLAKPKSKGRWSWLVISGAARGSD